MTNWKERCQTTIPTTALILILILAAGCTGGTDTKTQENGVTPQTTSTQKSKLVIGVLPDENPKKITKKNKPLKEYFEKELNREVEIHVPADYASLIVAFENDKVDIAYFGGLSYLKADERAGAMPMVSGKLEGTHLWNTTFIASTSSEIGSMKELTENPGKYSIVFGDPSSTSGHLMPSYHLKNKFGVDEKEFKDRTYSGTHTATALTIANGKSDVGALNKRIFDEMIETGKISREDVNEIWVTPGYADYVWAANPRTLNEEEIKEIKNSFLRIDKQEILGVQRVEGYVEINDKDFSKLRQAAKGMGMLNEDS